MRMKPVLFAALLTVPCLALAEGQYGKEGQKSGTMGQQTQQQRGQAWERGEQAHKAAVEQFRDQENFELKGKVSSVEGRNLILSRTEEQLPSVELLVPEGAQIRVDGQPAQLEQLQPGQDVRATFNLSEDQPLAIELEAGADRQQQRQQQPGMGEEHRDMQHEREY